MLKLHIGCGGDMKEGYVNIDADENCRPNLVRKAWDLPYELGSVDEIVSNHMLEHLTEQDGFKTLTHWFKILKPEGVLKMELPNFKEACREFVNETEEALKAKYPNFGRVAYYETVGRARNIHGGGTTPFDFHLWGYWPEYLEVVLKKIGFQKTLYLKADSYHTQEEPCFVVHARKT